MEEQVNKPIKLMFKLVVVAQVLVLALLAGCNGAVPTAVCHATGDPATPYQEVTVDATTWKDHINHPNDIYPAPADGCPTTQVVVTDGKITICHVTSDDAHPYNSITVSVNGLNGHAKHAGDIIPAPATGCPKVRLVATEGKITICHATGSDKNPYNEITISINGLNGHDNHEGDIIPAPSGGCPATKQ